MGITPEEYINRATSPEDRRDRKTIMFPLLYGAGPATIKRIVELGITPKQARKLLQDFNKNFKEVCGWKTS